MKNKVRVNDFLILISWVRVYQIFEIKRFNYENMLTTVENMIRDKIEYFDISDGVIDDFMADAYKLYLKILKSKEFIEKYSDSINLPYISKDVMMDETKKFENIIEYMLENIKYDDAEIRGIQKGFLTDKMKMCVDVEDYENAAKFRDLIKEC